MHHREHTIAVHAPADAVYGLVADATRWPLIFGPTVYVQSSEHAAPADGTGLEQRFRIWAQVSERVMGWTSSRSLDHRGLRISFRQEQAQPPVAQMSGQWRFEPLGHDTTRVVLLHEYAAVDDDSASPGGRGSSRGETPGEARPDMPSSASPGGRPPSDHVRWIDAALDRNSTAELGAVKAWAERGHRIEDLVSSFEDRMAVRGPAAQVYAFLHRADLWPRRLPHVDRLDLTSGGQLDGPGRGVDVQFMEMDTRDPAGRTHTTTSTRLCFPDRLIVYKQTTVPELLLAHCGEWALTAGPGGTDVVARHTVALDPGAVARVLGPGTALTQAREHVRQVLGANSRSTLAQARDFVESAEPIPAPPSR